MSIFTNEVLNPVKNALEGRVQQLPIHLQRVNDHVSIRKSNYTLIGGNTGSGKTSFVDHTFILQPFNWWCLNHDKSPIKFRALYRSMERKRSLKLAKWACWLMYMRHGLLIDSNMLLGFKKTKINEDVWKKLVACRDWIDAMLDYIDIRDGRTSPGELRQWVEQDALKHGTLFIADQFGLTNAKDPNTYIDNFSLGKTVTLKSGEIIPVVIVNHEGVDIVLRKGEKRYIPKDDNVVTVVVSDHLGKFVPDEKMRPGKPTVDAASAHNSDFRDVFGYSPVAISQFNRAIGDVQRMKFSEGDLTPQIEDFKESGNSQEDADLILALFNPFRYKSYDENGMYNGYNIQSRMVNPHGFNRFRSLTILKNSYGIDDVSYGMKFLGEVNHFSTLPHPTKQIAELEQVYAEIAQGR